MRRRRLSRIALGGTAAALLGPGLGRKALAQATGRWAPERPLRLIVPFAAGGPADLFGRIFAEALSQELGQAVVVENRTGSGGLTGTDAAAKAAPDGQVLAFTGAGALSIAPAMPQQRMPFDVYRDLAHLTLVVRVPEALVVNARSPHAGLAELVAAAKAKPGDLSFGSAGVGSITHLAGALLAKESGMEVVHVPYRGVAPAVTDLLAGRVAFVIADVPVLRPHIDAGALRPLAVTTARRIAALPQVPTTAELGIPRVISDNWYGLAVPAATPAPIQERLHEAALAALRGPGLVQEFARQGGEPAPLGRDEYLTFLRAEGTKWGPLVREAGAEAF
jgi:tripartite-type tricarboxylate transporter receptor subunit TctC